MGILRAFFIGIFVTFPLGVLIRVSITPQAYVYPVDLLVILFVIYGLYLLSHKAQKVVWFGSWKYFIAITIISLLINATWLEPRELIVSSLYILRLIAYLLMIPIISHLFSQKDSIWLLRVIAVSIFSTVVIGLIQYFLYPDLRNLMYLGWDEHLYRIFTTFLDPNFASVVFVLLLWILVYLFHVHRDNKSVKYSVGAIILVTISALLLTYSRTGYIALIGSTVVYCMLNKNIKLLLGFVLLLLTGLLFLPKNLQSEGVNLLRTASIESRVESYHTALHIFQQQPLLGIGFNAYRYAQEHYVDTSDMVSESHAGAGVSNSYLFVLVTTGLVGLGAFLYAIIKTLRDFMRLSNKHLKNMVIAYTTAILVGSISDNIFFYSFVLILFCCMNGIVKLATEKNER